MAINNNALISFNELMITFRYLYNDPYKKKFSSVTYICKYAERYSIKFDRRRVPNCLTFLYDHFNKFPSHLFSIKKVCTGKYYKYYCEKHAVLTDDEIATIISALANDKYTDLDELKQNKTVTNLLKISSNSKTILNKVEINDLKVNKVLKKDLAKLKKLREALTDNRIIYIKDSQNLEKPYRVYLITEIDNYPHAFLIPMSTPESRKDNYIFDSIKNINIGSLSRDIDKTDLEKLFRRQNPDLEDVPLNEFIEEIYPGEGRVRLINFSFKAKYEQVINESFLLKFKRNLSFSFESKRNYDILRKSAVGFKNAIIVGEDKSKDIGLCNILIELDSFKKWLNSPTSVEGKFVKDLITILSPRDLIKDMCKYYVKNYQKYIEFLTFEDQQELESEILYEYYKE